ncbi:MAG: oligoribonuclease [Bacteriovoracia bacterium]
MRKMFWVDCEMTGLDESVDRLLEVAVIVTDLELKVLDTYHQIVYQPPSILESMNDWCKNTHGKSGLTALVPNGAPIERVEKELTELAAKYYLPDERVVLCGNSVGMDKRFIDRYMPGFAKKLHYRVVDVTSFKEIFRSKWGVRVEKKEGHRALDDIQESIKEFQVYLQYIQVPENVVKK